MIRRFANILLASAVIAGVRHASGQTAPAPIATTTAGKVRGYVNAGILVFKGIQYGDDTAKHRFKAPVRVTPWEGVRDTMEFAPMAPQNGPSGGGAGGPGFFPPVESGTRGATNSEDCLYLNVWTPGLHDGKKRPVMVYFHGGGYSNGSVNMNLYDGTRLCRRGDITVVTVNGRLNGFGFLYLGELCGAEYADSGNAGMLDLVLALQWVHENIAQFGGDAENVTIFGQSGGGAKCSTLMAMPAARGLFHRVITMSGQQITGRTKAHATESAMAVLRNLNITPGQIAKIDQLTTQELIAGLRNGNWTPVVDGKSLPRDPFSPEASPLSADIPMMKGNTREETASLIGGGNNALFNLTWEMLPGQIRQSVGQYLGDLQPEQVVADYRRWYPTYMPSDVFFAATTAARSWKSMLVEVESRARQNVAPLYVYELDWKTPVEGGKYRAPHTLDIPLCFDNVAFARSMTGDGADAQRMADLMSDSFIAFARTGNPDTKALPHWPAYELVAARLKVDAEKMKALGVTIADVYAALAASGLSPVAERPEKEGREFGVAFHGGAKSMDLVVRNVNGAPVPLSAIAMLVEAPAGRATMIFDVKPSVVDDPRGEERKLFEKVVYVQPGT